jgi:hypothetical protein
LHDRLPREPLLQVLIERLHDLGLRAIALDDDRSGSRPVSARSSVASLMPCVSASARTPFSHSSNGCAAAATREESAARSSTRTRSVTDATCINLLLCASRGRLGCRYGSEEFPRIEPSAATSAAELVHGCTFDDFLLTPQRSVVVAPRPAAIDLSCRVSRRLTLRRPIVSANMDTVTRAPMAIVQAEEGGIGIIDRGFRSGDIQPQVREVEIVKRTQHGVIGDPYSVAPSASADEAAALMTRSRVGTLVVVDERGRLQGC